MRGGRVEDERTKGRERMKGWKYHDCMCSFHVTYPSREPFFVAHAKKNKTRLQIAMKKDEQQPSSHVINRRKRSSYSMIVVVICS
jgi:hypothetical protein